MSVADRDLAGAASDIEDVVRKFRLIYALDHLPDDKKHLAEEREFRHRLATYLNRSIRKEGAVLLKEGAAIQHDYDLDPQSLRMPRDTRIQVRGEVQRMRLSFGEMGFSLLLAVLLVYLVMAAQFASWIDPLIMIVSAPLGLIGVAFTLWGTGTSLNIQSCMGVLMMVGISVSNSVLVVEFANRQREAGMRTRDAILGACSVRLRPILMTTMATLVSLAPMAIHLHPGDEMNLPLARAVIGGLAGSTLLTLFVVPILYALLKPKHARGVSLEQVLATADGPPPSDPAATFATHVPVSDWGESAFPTIEETAGGKDELDKDKGPRTKDEGREEENRTPPPS